MPHFENLKLYELRSLARDLNIPVEAIRQSGDLRLRDTWLSAIADATTESEAGATPTSPQNVSNYELLPILGICSEFVTEFASIIGHPALHEGELREVADGYDYIGTDERGLPIAIVEEEIGILYSIHSDDYALPLGLGMEYFLHCLRNRLQLHSYSGVAA